MIDDEMQVLGKPSKLSKREGWLIAIVLLSIVLALGIAFYLALLPQQPIKMRTEEAMGNSTIIPELQAVADSILKAKLEEIDGLR